MVLFNVIGDALGCRPCKYAFQGTVNLAKVPKSRLPIICFRYGSLPLADGDGSLNDSGHSVLVPLFNTSFEGIQALQNGEQCYPVQKNFTVNLTNEQISPGVWYFGLFNGIGPTRTQSKMINRGPSYSFSANISVEGCTTSTMWGQYCNQTIDSLSCALTSNYSLTGNSSEAVSYNQTIEIVACKNNFETSCLGDGESKVYTLDVMGVAEELHITARNVSFNVASPNNTGNFSEINLMCIVRHGAMPSPTLHDYSGDINKAPLVIRSPKIGRWYISFLPFNLSKELGGIQGTNIQVCYSMESNVVQCPLGKAGPNCTWEKYILQTVLRRGSAPFESYYLPVSGKVISDSANFPLEPILTNSSYSGEPDESWTYFILDIPRGAAGGNVHIRLTSDTKITSEIYARFGGLPSLDSWDYYYANKTRNSDGSMFFKLYNSSEGKVDFYILSIREGTWSFGFRRRNDSNIASRDQTTMSISLERCPKRCSSHGECKFSLDASGLALYSYCSCDRNHGGFDCSVEIVSHKGHILQSVSLIASNAAAVFPAFWALRQKALAEWVIYTSSGISSGLYHACDVGTWCALSFNVLQFLDFWLSFMAVVSTFVYLATIDEVFKRAIHTALAIITALMAVTKATRSSNIILVIAIGSLGLLVGWLIEYSTKLRSFSFPMGLCLNMIDRWLAVRGWLRNLVKTIFRRFVWGYVLAGFAALAMAAISWKLETSESYWIWHSIWHVTIYTSSFFFLCSKANTVNNEDERPPDQTYALARQDSIPRGE
ncbi:EGF-like, conserved site [Trema orientale]|uniref:EGF-like, conserved site n=1 Tax=Trema orientale TaxID=63057 RepID=A0A2P5FHT5_TREOI|nr:EGF-like, conserved site [Trema orientale]